MILRRFEMNKIMVVLISLLFFAGCTTANNGSTATVVREGGKAYIVDQTGFRWDVTEAESVGFKPERFQYGMGKGAFTPLDDSSLKDSGKGVPKDLRVIGVEEGPDSKAYSVSLLTRHEVSNSTLGNKPIAVGY
jgi:hypothetical protein